MANHYRFFCFKKEKYDQGVFRKISGCSGMMFRSTRKFLENYQNVQIQVYQLLSHCTEYAFMCWNFLPKKFQLYFSNYRSKKNGRS